MNITTNLRSYHHVKTQIRFFYSASLGVLFNILLYSGLFYWLSHAREMILGILGF